MPKTTSKTSPKTKQTKKNYKVVNSSIDFSQLKGIDKKYKNLKVNVNQSIFSPKIKPIKGQTYKNKSKFVQVAVKSTSILDKKQIEFLTNYLNNEMFKSYGNKYKIEARNAIKSGAYCMEKNRYLIEQEDLNHKIKEYIIDSNDKHIVEADEVNNNTNTFYITYYLTNQSGNEDENNKCFYNILKENDLIDDIDEFIKENEFDEDGTVSKKDIPKIEDLLNVNIEVYGDMLYKRININEKGNIIKTKKYEDTLIMELRNGHYIKYEDKPEKMPGITRKYSEHKRFNILWKLKGDKELYFDGNDIVDKIDLNNSYYMNFTQIKYYVEDINKFNEDNVDVEYLRKCYENYINDLNEFNNILKKYNEENNFKYFEDFYEFRGMIDYIKNFLNKNDKMNKIKTFKKYEQFERIEKNEFDWLNAASKGGVYSYNYKEEYDKKDCYIYDINSAYPACLLSNNFYFPYKRGEFIKINEKYFYDKIKNTVENKGKDKLQYGIYKCKISYNNEELNPIEITRISIFKFNENNYYTHYDLIVAYKLGLNIKLINDKINALVYSNDNVNIENNKLCLSPVQFRKIISSLYQLKDETHNRFIKQMLNQIWGLLSTHNKGDGKKNKIYINKDEEDDEFEIEQDEYIENINDKDDYYELTKYNYDKITLYRYYRLKPFILSFQRYNMFKVYEYLDENYTIKGFNTDSFCINKELTEEEFNDLNKWYKNEIIKCDYKDNYSSLGEFKKEDKKEDKKDEEDEEDEENDDDYDDYDDYEEEI